MGNDVVVVDTHEGHGFKKKTSFQLQSLEDFYKEDKYPKKTVLEDYAASLNLTYKQIRTWFVERRRKEKRNNEAHSFMKKHDLGNSRDQTSSGRAVKFSRTNTDENIALFACHRGVGQKDKRNTSSKHKQPSNHSQVLLSKDYILKRVLREDGPHLGVEFDPLPEKAFSFDTKYLHSCQEKQIIHKRRKVMESRLVHPETLPRRDIPVKNCGIGKGLMTVWRAVNCNSGKFPIDISFVDEREARMPLKFNVSRGETLRQVPKRSQRSQLVPRQRSVRKQMQKRRPPVKKTKGRCRKDNNHSEPQTTECRLSIDELTSPEQSDALMLLVDDEDLEMEELQAAPNPLSCSVHLASNGRHGCPLCKDLLPRFPPQIVKMKQPFCRRPWDSSPELVKKLFKVFRFLYGHATSVKLCPFTIDEFAQAFVDKDSLLLGRIHVALLKMLLLDVEREMTAGYVPRSSKDCRFLGFLHFVREQEFHVNFWSQSLNPLTWTEILRQVLIAAGFGSKSNTLRKELLSKERNHMAKYGLQPCTLKGELFNMLSEKGSNGSKVSELAKASQIAALDLPQTSEELEELICSALSSDITLFEKIAPSSYRLRVDPHIKGRDNCESDTEDSGSVSDDSGDSSKSSSSDESDNSMDLHLSVCKRTNTKYKPWRKTHGEILADYNEIDESFTGEAWVLGLMEGEYSNLSIEEKLDALVALIDLAGAGCSLRKQEPARAITASFPDNRYHGSGAKIKKSLTFHHQWAREKWEGSAHGAEGISSYPNSFPVDTSESFPNASEKGHSSTKINDTDPSEESWPNVHPHRSIYLGTDRRYNSYWLFLGPCNPNDPGHRRIYFESSEDGHWEVIDTAQAFHALLSVLDRRGSRESRLFESLETRKAMLCQAMHDYITAEIGSRPGKVSDPSDTDNSTVDNSSPFSDIDNNFHPSESTSSLLVASDSVVIEVGKNAEDKKQRWNRLQAFDKWIWNSFYLSLNVVKNSTRSYMESLVHCEDCHDLYWMDEKHCRICHSTFEVDFDLEEQYAIHVATCKETEDSSVFPKHKVLPSQLQALKAAIHAIELNFPEEAWVGAWKISSHKLWVKRLRRTSSLPELLQVLTDLVGTINEEWLHKCAFSLGSHMALDEITVYFQTMPQTTAAVALLMVKLDMLIAPHLERLRSERILGNIPRSKRKRPCTKWM